MKKILGGLLVSFLLGSTAMAQNASGPVKLGVINDQNSSFSAIGGRAAVEAARMAIEDFGGKVLGKPIELLNADHQNKPDVAMVIVREWLDQQGVDAVVDMANSAIAVGVNMLLKDKKRLGLFVAPGVSRIVEEDCNGYGMLWAYDSPSMARVSALAQARRGTKSWFIISPDYTSGVIFETAIKEVAAETGGKVLGAIRVPLGTTDFSSFVLQAQASKAEVVMLTLNGPDLVNAVKQIQEFGLMKSGQRVGAVAVNDFEAKQAGVDNLKGLEFMLPWNWVLDAQTRAFHKRLMDRTGVSATWDHAGVYSVVTNYLKAVEAAGTKEPLVVAAKMRSSKIEDFFAHNATLLPNGRLIHDVYVLQIKGSEEVKEGWDVSRVIATIPAEQAFPPIEKSVCPLVKKG